MLPEISTVTVLSDFRHFLDTMLRAYLEAEVMLLYPRVVDVLDDTVLCLQRSGRAWLEMAACCPGGDPVRLMRATPHLWALCLFELSPL